MVSSEASPVSGATPEDDLGADQRVLEETFLRFRTRGRGQAGSTSRVRRHADFGRSRSSKVAARPIRRPDAGADFDWAAMAQLEAQDGVKDQKLPLRRPGGGRPYSGRDPGRIDAVLDSQLKERGWKEPLQVGAVVGRWEDIVGRLVAMHCPVESFHDGKLLVRAQSSAWAQQLRLLLPEVMDRIAEVVGVGVVEKVVVQGPRAPSWKHGVRSSPGRGPRDTYG